jgi:hypothetical protein
MSEISWAAIAPLLVLLLAFVVWCWVDMSRHEVRYLPRWLWAIIVAMSLPLGGIAYLLFGRDSAPIR